MAAAPSLPGALNTGDVLGNAHVDAYYDLFEFFRNNRPVFKAQLTFASTGQNQPAIVDSTDTELQASDGAGAFNYTPDINIGTFEPGTGGEYGIYLPLDGVYVVVVSAEWESNGTGYRQIGVKNEGAYFDDSRGRIPAVSGGVTRQQVTVMITDGVDGDELTFFGLQNSGGGLDVEAFVSVYWLVDS